MRISALRGRAMRALMLTLAVPSIGLTSPTAFWLAALRGDAVSADLATGSTGDGPGEPGSADLEAASLVLAGRRPPRLRLPSARDASFDLGTRATLDLLPALSSNGHRRLAFTWAMLLDGQRSALVAHAHDAVELWLFDRLSRSTRESLEAWADLTDSVRGFEQGAEPRAVPEPGTGLLLALGLVWAARLRRAPRSLPSDESRRSADR